MRRRILIVVLIVLAIAVLAADHVRDSRLVHLPGGVTKQRVYQVPITGRVYAEGILMSGTHWGCVVVQGSRATRGYFVIDGIRRGHADDPSVVEFSADGRTFAYEYHRGNSGRMVINGVKQPYAGRIGTFLFSSDNAHYAYLVYRDKCVDLIVDGVKRAEHDAIHNLSFREGADNPDYIGISNGSYVVVRDGKAASKPKRLGVGISPVFSADGGHYAYVKGTTKQRICIDGVDQKDYESVERLVFSADGKHFAYTATQGPKTFWVCDGVEYDAPFGEGYTKCSPGGKLLCGVVRVGAGEAVVINGVPSPVYDEIKSVGFSPDGSRCAYIAQANGKSICVVDGKVEATFDAVDSMRFSPDGSRIAYAVSSGRKEHVVADGRAYQPYNRIQQITFGPDGHRLAFAAVLEMKMGLVKSRVVVDGREQPVYDEVGGVIFSDDGRRFAYTAREGKKWFVVIDGVKQEEMDRIVALAADPTGQYDFIWYGWSGRIVSVCDGEMSADYVTGGGGLLSLHGALIAQVNIFALACV